MLTTTSRANRHAGAAIARASIARAVMLITGAIALVLVVGILLVVLEANPSNDLVQVFRDAAAFLAGPFDDLFTLDSTKAERAVNWGIAAVVYLVVAGLIAKLLTR